MKEANNLKEFYFFRVSLDGFSVTAAMFCLLPAAVSHSKSNTPLVFNCKAC